MPVIRLMLAVVLAGAVMSQRAPRVAAEPLPPAPAWQLTCVDCPKRFGELTDRGLRLDAAGHPHIAYGGDHLYYATHDGSIWRYETVDGSSGVGSAASLALDAAGRPAISYYDGLNQDLKFAYRDGSGWHTETVDSGGAVGVVTALDLDATGRAHIVYLDNTHQTLKYARRGASGWLLELVGAANRQVTPISLAVDSTGAPHVGYYTANDLMYAKRSAAGWMLATVAANVSRSWSCSLALDSANRPHIAFPANGRQSKIAHWTGVAWQIEALSWGGDEPNYFSLAIGAGDYPHISAMVIMQYEPTSWVVAHQYKDAAGWHSIGGFGTIHSAGQTSLALDAAGRPTIGHVGGDTLVLSVLAGATWQSQGVDVSRNVGRLTSLALDGSGRPVIAYAPQRIAAWTGGAWIYDDFFPAPGEPTGISMALGRDGQPRVAYSWYWSLEIFEEAGIDYVYRDGAGWHRTALFHGGQSARAGPPALALDASDAPQVSGGVFGLPSSPPYEPALTITHFRRTSAGWTSEIVEGPSDWAAPRAVSLDLDANGNPVIGYIAPQGDALKVASYGSASGWRYEVVDPAGGEGLSLTLDGAGQPRLSYARSGQLKYAARDPGGWRIVDVAAGNFAETALALDASGYPHIP